MSSTPPPGSKPPTAAKSGARSGGTADVLAASNILVTSAAAAVGGSGDLLESPDGPVALASSTQCDLTSCAFVRLLISEFRAGRDDIVRDGIAKALALSGDVNASESTVAEIPDLGAAAIVDVYFAALEFAAAQSFTAIQTQQLLLLLVDTLDLVPSYAPRFADADAAGPPAGPPAASAAAAAVAGSSSPDGTPCHPPSSGAAPLGHPLNTVLYHFSRKLSRLCTATEMLVDERSVVIEERIEEHVDPAAQSAYDAKLAKAKKGQAVEPPAKISVKVSEEKEVFDRKTITVGPYFDQADVARVIEFFNTTVFQHWALFQLVLTCPRTIERETTTVFLDNVPTFLAPLSAAVPLADYDAAQERLAVEEGAEKAVADLDAEASAAWADLTADASNSAREVMDRDERVKKEDAEAAMSAAEFEHAKRALDSAVKAATTKKVTQTGLLARIERVEAAAANGIPPAKAAADAASPVASPTGPAAGGKARK